MYSIGQLSHLTKVKVPTIRYYEGIGLMPAPERTRGNQRRYDKAGLQRLSFIRHARELGFSIDAITSLIRLQDQPDHNCRDATDLAVTQLAHIREKIRRLRALERELIRISDGCDGDSMSQNCYVLNALADHDLCSDDHS